MIKNISGEDIHRITSGQVIVDLATAVKELIENSIDAHATQIECNFKNYGLESLDISDNGDGISPEDFDSIALKHHTSKLSTFSDLEKVNTLGFRGEALSSLCGIATMKIITTQQGPKATALSFDTSGYVNEKKICTRNKGTTVFISELFKNLPVRKKDMIKNHKREFNKCLSLLQNYTLINTDVKFAVYNTTPKGKKTIVLSSQGSGSIKNNIISVFGSNGMHGLVPVDITLDLNQYKSRLKVLSVQNDYKIHITGFISKTSFGYGRSATDRQVLFINKRPVELKQFSKVINEVYKSYNNVQYPAIIFNLEMDTQYIDVNVTPDKRTILIHNEIYVIEELRLKLVELFDSQDISIPRNMQSQRSFDVRSTKEEEVEEKPIISLKGMQFAYGQADDKIDEVDENEMAQDVTESPSRIHEETPEMVVMGKGLIMEGPEDDDLEIVDSRNSRKRPSDTQLVKEVHKRVQMFLTERELEEQEDLNALGPAEEHNGVEVIEDDDIPEDAIVDQNNSRNDEEVSVVTPVSNRPAIRSKVIDLSQLSSFRNGSTTTPTPLQSSESLETYARSSSRMKQPQLPSSLVKIYGDDDDCDCGHESSDEKSQVDNLLSNTTYDNLKSTGATDTNSSFDNSIQFVKTVKSISKEKHPMFETRSVLPPEFAHVITPDLERTEKKVEIDDIENKDESESYLTLTVAKSDFNEMKIIGQFNLGFILVIREKDRKQDLFIVDQHASDEKYNFEDLQKNTVFESQRLVIPQMMELNTLDELVVMENIDVFEKNGFQLKIDEEAPPGERIMLISLPISKRTAFDTTDFNELVHLVKENPGNTSSLRCSKIRSMFAMRACRKSIMVGRHLNFKTMSRLVKNLGTLDKPWNCPHGRPTMRHLIELQQWKPFNEDYVL